VRGRRVGKQGWLQPHKAQLAKVRGKTAQTDLNLKAIKTCPSSGGRATTKLHSQLSASVNTRRAARNAVSCEVQTEQFKH
jgi:hypothetical protein